MISTRMMTRTTTGIKVVLFLLLSCMSMAAEDYALIAGTVFRPDGSAFPRVEVMLASESGGKPQKTKSDARGEFSFRVPAKQARYNVNVQVTGFRKESKSVSIQGDERVDVSVLLELEK